MKKIFTLLLLLFTFTVNSFAVDCPSMVTNGTAVINGDGTITVGWDIDCTAGAACSNGVLYYVGIYGQESEPAIGLNSEYGFGTFIAPGCNFTRLWDGDAGNGIDPKASTCAGSLFGIDADFSNPGFEFTFDKDALCSANTTAMSLDFPGDSFCPGESYDVWIWEIQTNVAPGAALTSNDIACVSGMAAESPELIINNAFTIPGALVQIPDPIINITGDLTGTFTGCGNVINVDCDQVFTFDLEATGGCVSNSIAGYYAYNPSTCPFPTFTAMATDQGISGVDDYDFVFGDNFVDPETGDPIPLIYKQDNPFEDVSFSSDVEVCVFVQDMCNGTTAMTCVQVNVSTTPIVVDALNLVQGGCSPDNNTFQIDVSGGSGGPYTITYDNGQGVSGSVGDNTLVNIGEDGGLFTVTVSDNGGAPIACDTTFSFSLQRLLSPQLLPNPRLVTICEGLSNDVPLTMVKEIVIPSTLTENPTVVAADLAQACTPANNGIYTPLNVPVNANNPDGSNTICDLVASATTIQQICFTFTVPAGGNTTLFYLSIDNIDGQFEQLYIGTGFGGTDADLGPGTHTICFDAGVATPGFDGTFDGSTSGSWVGANPDAWIAYFEDASCQVSIPDIIYDSYSITYNDACSQFIPAPFGTPTATWTPDAGNPAPALSLAVGGNNGDLGTFTTPAGSAGNTYTYDIVAVDELGCPATAQVIVDVIEPVLTPSTWTVPVEQCIDDPVTAITPNNTTGFSNRTGMAIILSTDNFAGETTFDVFDKDGTFMFDETSFALANNSTYVLWDNSCFDETQTAGIPGSITIFDSFGDGLLDNQGGGLSIYSYSVDGLSAYANDVGADGVDIPNSLTGFGEFNTSHSVTNGQDETFTAGGFTLTFAVGSFLNRGVYSGAGITNDQGTATLSLPGHPDPAGDPQRSITVPFGTATFDPAVAGVMCEPGHEITYTYSGNLRVFGDAYVPSTCSCDEVTTEITAVRERAVINGNNVLSCSPDGTTVNLIDAGDLTGTAVGYEMNVDGAGWEPLGAVQVTPADGSKIVVVRADDGCTDNTCTDQIELFPSLPVPLVKGASDNSCTGGAAPYTVTIDAELPSSCTGCVIEYSFDGGTTFGTTNSVGGVPAGGTVNVVVRTNDGGTFNTCPDATFSYTIGDCPPTLPISLLSFNAVNKGSQNHLDWATGQEQDADYFDVERSIDNLYFHKIGRVKASGNSTTRKDYKFVDTDAPYGTAYYRLNQVDFDGLANKTNVVSAKRRIKGVEITAIVPNPTINTTDIKYEAAENGLTTVLKLTDITGKVLMSNTVIPSKGLNTYSLDLSTFSVGMYFISIEVNGETSVKKVIKK